jgi:hypothetical protein
MRPGKGPSPGVTCSLDAKSVTSGAARNTVDEYRLKPLQREVARPIWELKSGSQNGNPAYLMKR